MGTFEEAKASVCLALRRCEEAELNRDKLLCGDAVDPHTGSRRPEMREGGEGSGSGGGGDAGDGGEEGSAGRVRDDKNEFSCSKYQCDQKVNKIVIEGVGGGNGNSSTLPLPSPNSSSTPFILAVLRTHVLLDFNDLNYFHLISVEEILKTYGIEFSN